MTSRSAGRATRAAILLVTVSLASTACRPTAGAVAGPAAQATTVTVFAAASLKTAMQAAIAAYAPSAAAVQVELATDSSAALRARIEQGAPADLFLSADTANAQALVDSGAAGGPVVPFAGNALALVVPIGNPAAIVSPADLARPGVRVMAAGNAVPITRYATRLIERLASLPGYPRDFVARYGANVASREDNVAALVTKVGLGEGDAGIAYATDALVAATSVTSVPLPSEAQVRVTYGAVVLAGPSQGSGSSGGSSAGTRSRAAARAFLTWLTGAEGQRILARFGFLVAAS